MTRERAFPTALDSSVVVASLLAAHQSHRVAVAAVEEVLSSEGGFLLPVHAALESFSVLTRLPSPHRLRPEDAGRLLRETCGVHARLVASPPPSRWWSFLSDLAAARVVGGRAYDALILRSALDGGARRLLTLNPRHFADLVPAGFAVVAPGSSM